jgi:hypothetical protein
MIMRLPGAMATCKKTTTLILLVLFSCLHIRAEFGIPRATGTEGGGASVDANGNIEPMGVAEDYDGLIVAKLLSAPPQTMSEQTAVNIATVLKAASKDPETILLIRRMKEGSGRDTFQGLVADIRDMKQVVQALSELYEEIRSMEVLFKDPVKAYQEMKKDGMIPPDKEELYEKDPALFESDSRKSIYFAFVGIAAAAGLL